MKGPEGVSTERVPLSISSAAQEWWWHYCSCPSSHTDHWKAGVLGALGCRVWSWRGSSRTVLEDLAFNGSALLERLEQNPVWKVPEQMRTGASLGQPDHWPVLGLLFSFLNGFMVMCVLVFFPLPCFVVFQCAS